MSFPKASWKLLHTEKPIIIGGIPTTNGPEEMAVRIMSHPRRWCGLPKPSTDAGETQSPDDEVAPARCMNGRGDGSWFELYADVPNHGYGQGAVCGSNEHAVEDFSWLVTEEGIFEGVLAGHVLSKCGGGALCPSGGDHADGFDWIQAVFDPPVSDPVVVSQMQTHTGPDWAKTRHQNVDENGFQVKMEEDGLDIGHNQEVYGYIALTQGTGLIGSLSYEAIVTPDAVTHIPYQVDFSKSFGLPPGFFGSIHTFDGPDPAHLRQTDPVTKLFGKIFVEEETCSDAELGHTTEKVSILAIDTGVSGQPGVGSNTLLEVGTAEAAGASVQIKYINDYDKPLIFAGIPTSKGPEEVALRLQRGPRTWCGGSTDTYTGKPAPDTAVGNTPGQAGTGTCQSGSNVRDAFDIYADQPHSCGHAATAVEESFAWMIVEEGKWGPAQAGNALGYCGGGAICPGGDHQTGLQWVTGVKFYEPITDPVVFGLFQTHTGGKIVILSRFVALSVSLIQKVSLLQATGSSRASGT